MKIADSRGIFVLCVCVHVCIYVNVYKYTYLYLQWSSSLISSAGGMCRVSCRNKCVQQISSPVLMKHCDQSSQISTVHLSTSLILIGIDMTELLIGNIANHTRMATTHHRQEKECNNNTITALNYMIKFNDCYWNIQHSLAFITCHSSMFYWLSTSSLHHHTSGASYDISAQYWTPCHVGVTCGAMDSMSAFLACHQC